MASPRKSLRPRLPKQPKQRAKSNAEHCRAYKEKIKSDPSAYEAFKVKRKQENDRWLAKLSPDKKEEMKEKARLRQQKRREKLKQMKGPQSTPSTPTEKITRKKSKDKSQKDAELRERNKMSQRKRRANMSSQKKRREREKKREYYHKKKASSCVVENGDRQPTCRKRISLPSLLRGIHNTLKRSRSKLALFKLAFVKKLLSRQVPPAHQTLHTRYKRKPRNNFSVEHFYEKCSVDYPGKRDGSQQTKVLTKSLLDLYTVFNSTHPENKVSLTTFKRRRPSYIALSSSRKFQQCLCEKCTNCMLIMEVLNCFLRKKSDKKHVCEKVTSVDELVAKTICVEFQRDCLERECGLCGVEGLISAYKREIGENMKVSKHWRRWEKTDSCRKDLVIRESPVGTLVDMLSEDLKKLAKHLKVAHWQRRQYQHIADNLPVGHAVITLDFAENYLCKYQNEIQSAHWSYHQVSLHPCVFFYRCRKGGCRKTLTEYLVFMSDDLKHDAAFAKVVLDKCIEHLKSKGIVACHIFSDGAGSQYKSKTTFYHLTEVQKKHSDVKLTRHFFGSNHGKSLCDSLGGVVKNSVARVVVSGEVVVQNSHQMLQVCNQKLKEEADDNCLHSKRERSFQLIVSEDLARDRAQIENLNLKRVVGTLDIHCLFPSNKLGVLQAKALSCFCCVCMLGEEGACQFESYTLGWKQVDVCKLRQGEGCKTKKKKCASTVTNTVSVSTKGINSATHCSSLACEPQLLCPDPSADRLPLALDSDPCTDSLPSTREEFFHQYQSLLSSCHSFDEVYVIAKNLLVMVDQYPMPKIIPRPVWQVGIVDKVAQKLQPSGYENLFPVLTLADGNCVPRSFSLLCFGNQLHHEEIRCRIVSELALNTLDYLNLEQNMLQLICQLSDNFNESVTQTFQDEVLSVCKPSSYMGMWQVMAAANVFHAPVISVYPSLGPRSYQTLCNRTLMPRECRSTHGLTIMWSSCSTTSAHEYWTANHVVPLMPMVLSE